MALINCEECGKQVSEKAQQFSSCGNPIAKAKRKFLNPEENVQTIQKTNKKQKLIDIIFAVLLILGIMLSVSGNSSGFQLYS